MTMMAQRPDDTLAQWTQMAAPPPQMSVDPHATLTAPISPAPIQMTNELGDPMGRTNELGDALPEKAEAPPAAEPDTKMSAQKEHIGKNLMADYQKDADPYGSPDNHPGFFGKVLHGLNVATGGVNRRGWEEEGLEGRLQNIGKEESTEGLQGAQAANQTAEAGEHDETTKEMPGRAASEEGLQGAQANEAKARTSALAEPSLATAYAHAVNDSLKNGNDPATDPVVQHIANAIRMQTKPEEPKTTDIKSSDGKVHTMGYDDKTGKYDVDEGESGFKPAVTNVNAGDVALDREATRLGKPYEKGVSDADSQLEKIADARSMVNGSAEAQALGIPKVLTALVSGQGSGVRITQPELTAIARARGLIGDVQGTLNTWAGKGKLTPTQQKQLTGILDDVKARIIAKQAIYSTALDKINGASSREEVIQADKEARQKLNDLEKGGSQHAVGDKVSIGGKQVTIKKLNPDGTFDY
jgi:hypothetical protein